MTDAPRGTWAMVWWLSAAQLVVWGTLFYAFALFVVPMERDLGWSRSELNGALTLGLLVSGLLGVPVGAWIDRYGGRFVLTGGALLGGAMLAAWSFTNDLIVFYAIWIMIGVAQAATLYSPAFAVLAVTMGGEFKRAITAMTLVGGFASTVFIPLTQVLIDAFDWRPALLILAACNIGFCAVIHYFALAGTAPPRASAPRAETVSPLGGILRAPVFWALAVALLGQSYVASATIFHLVPLLLGRGVTLSAILSAIALIGPLQVAGRLLLFAAGRRATTTLVGYVCFGLMALAIIVLAVAADAGAAIIFTVLYGAANGIATILRATIVQELFGAENYARINGAIGLPVTIAKALGPLGAALVWEASGGYAMVIAMLFVIALISLAAFVVVARGLRHDG